MKQSKVIYDVNDLSSCKDMDKSVKYVTLDIKSVNSDVVSYFVNNENDYFYSDRIDNKRGYVYVDYATFVKGQEIINNIINGANKRFSKFELARYLYVSLGKTVGMDKVKFFSLNGVGNVWGSLASGRVNNIVLCKIYMYLCSYFDITCDIITNNETGSYVNWLNIDGNSFVVDLYSDLYLIQAGFDTKGFGSYNEDMDLDKKIGYKHNDKIIDRIMSSIDIMDENMVMDILIKSEKIFDIDNIKSFELGEIYKYLFNRYCPNYDVVVNNLFINNKDHEHFILISYGDKHYCYNYDKSHFAIIDNDNLINNLEAFKIGIYDGEVIPNVSKKVGVLS